MVEVKIECDAQNLLTENTKFWNGYVVAWLRLWSQDHTTALFFMFTIYSEV